MSVATHSGSAIASCQASTRQPLPFWLLHGTGGDEDDFLPLAHIVSPAFTLLSPRGMVLEGGMPRFFRRLSEGVFDEDDLRRRTTDLAAFVAEDRAEHEPAAPVAVGTSNGANTGHSKPGFESNPGRKKTIAYA